MSISFSIFDLHDSVLDIHPRSWICFRGDALTQLVADVEHELRVSNDLSRESLSKIIAEQLGCSVGVIKNLLQGKSVSYPIPVLVALANMLSTIQRKKFLFDTERACVSLKVNSASARPVRAVKRLDATLAKIAGAFMADGSLSAQATITATNRDALQKILDSNSLRSTPRFSKTRKQYYATITLSESRFNVLGNLLRSGVSVQTHYVIDLVEEFQDSVEAFNQWMAEIFSISPTVFMQHRNAWRSVYSNKILARYFMHFFEVSPGSKTFTAHEPRVIQHAPLGIRRMFARGVLMFDGSINTTPAITFSTKSECLWASVKEILIRDGIHVQNHKQNARGEWTLVTYAHTPKKKLTHYFEHGTQKYKLLLWMFGDTKQKPVIKTGKRISTESVIMLLAQIKQSDISYLVQHFHAKHIVVKNIVNILERQKRVSVTNKPRRLGPYVSIHTSVSLTPTTREELFKKMRACWGKDVYAAEALGVGKGTFSAWRRGVNRMPVQILQNILHMTHTDPNMLTGKIASVDRMILESTF